MLNQPVGSVQVPARRANLLVTAKSVHAYLAADAALESAANGITAAAMEAALARVETSELALQAAEIALQNAIDARNACEQVLRENLIVLRAKLRKLGSESNLWYAFGYSRPADPETPEIPAEVTATAEAPGMISVSWQQACRAVRYRVYVKPANAAANEPIAPMLTTLITQASCEGLIPGTQYSVTVTAVNRAGESLESTPVLVFAI